MWICPKCGRQFKRTNQGHYCGNAPQTVEEYIELQSIEIHSHLKAIRNIICNSVPAIHEYISWSMPTYKKSGRSISFAACQKHISLYVDSETIHQFASELNEITTNKNAIYFPYHQALPLELIKDIVQWYFH